MEYLNEITDFMGGQSIVGKPASDFEFIEIIRGGLSPLVVNNIAKSSSISKEKIFRSVMERKRGGLDQTLPIKENLQNLLSHTTNKLLTFEVTDEV